VQVTGTGATTLSGAVAVGTTATVTGAASFTGAFGVTGDSTWSTTGTGSVRLCGNAPVDPALLPPPRHPRTEVGLHPHLALRTLPLYFQATVPSLAIQSASTAVQNTLQVTAGVARTTYAGSVIYGALTSPVVAGTKLLALTAGGAPLLTVTTSGTTATNGLTVTTGGVSVTAASTFTGPVAVTASVTGTSFQVSGS
jgi:hypothetical protein